jgi:hypothetical protein
VRGEERVGVALGEDGLRDERNEEQELLGEEHAGRLADVLRDARAGVQVDLLAVAALDLVRAREEERELPSDQQ